MHMVTMQRTVSIGNCTDAALLLIRALRLWILNGDKGGFEMCT